ncbi:RlpA-like double-psi beta-barrel-protein domain-containing protein-containing protein [Ganoderma leucocontextum]|nr:RlpA-like double-psi beta-barrel-protein domain-containing protein-containing protein [Ganoderma leucocontextum]
MAFKSVLAAVLAVAFIGSAHVSAAPASDTAETFFGDATWYTPDGELGACGAPSQNSDLVVALSADQYAEGTHCWRHIGVHYQGQLVDATVVDLCPGCASGSIDLSPAAFEQLAPLDDGRVEVSWDFE